MFMLKYALKNLFRRWGRNGISMVSIIAGVTVIIAGRSLIGGFKESIVRGHIDSIGSHVVAMPVDYPSHVLQHPVEDLVEVDDQTAAWLDDNAEAWTERLLFLPRAIHGPDAMRVRVFGYDPVTDATVFPRDQWTVEGAIPETIADGLMISKGVARILDLELGDLVVLEQRTHAGSLNALQVPVGGIVTTTNPMLDRIGAFAPMPLAEELVRSGGEVSHLCVRLADRDDAFAFRDQLQERLGDGVHVTDWREETADLVATQDIRQSILDAFGVVLLLIAAAGIANTVLIAAYERVKEIGTLRAMGITRRGVLALFVTEGLALGTVGSIIGCALGTWLMYLLATTGLDFTALIEDAGETGVYDNMPFTVMIYGTWSEAMVVAGFVIGVAIAVLASLYPAHIASNLAPAEAVRAE